MRPSPGRTPITCSMIAWSADRKSTRLNSSHGYISYAVSPDRHPFPTRRSSDLLWPVIEAALLAPGQEEWLDAPPEPLVHYAGGEARIALLSPAAWRARDAAEPGQDADHLQHDRLERRSEEHTSELQSRLHLVCRQPGSPPFPYTTLFRSAVAGDRSRAAGARTGGMAGRAAGAAGALRRRRGADRVAVTGGLARARCGRARAGRRSPAA